MKRPSDHSVAMDPALLSFCSLLLSFALFALLNALTSVCSTNLCLLDCVCSPQVHAAADQMSLLRNENRRLREELSGFNVQFFEEIEDLKFAYLTQVRR